MIPTPLSDVEFISASLAHAAKLLASECSLKGSELNLSFVAKENASIGRTAQVPEKQDEKMEMTWYPARHSKLIFSDGEEIKCSWIDRGASTSSHAHHQLSHPDEAVSAVRNTATLDYRSNQQPSTSQLIPWLDTLPDDALRPIYTFSNRRQKRKNRAKKRHSCLPAPATSVEHHSMRRSSRKRPLLADLPRKGNASSNRRRGFGKPKLLLETQISSQHPFVRLHKDDGLHRGSRAPSPPVLPTSPPQQVSSIYGQSTTLEQSQQESFDHYQHRSQNCVQSNLGNKSQPNPLPPSNAQVSPPTISALPILEPGSGQTIGEGHSSYNTSQLDQDFSWSGLLLSADTNSVRKSSNDEYESGDSSMDSSFASRPVTPSRFMEEERLVQDFNEGDESVHHEWMPKSTSSTWAWSDGAIHGSSPR